MLEPLRRLVSQHPAKIVAGWLALAVTTFLTAPDLSRLAAEGQARLLPEEAESARGASLVREVWPDAWQESAAVLVLHRPEGLGPADAAYAARLEARFRAAMADPAAGLGLVLRVAGPGSVPELAERLVSADRTTQLLLLPMSEAFVAPATQETVGRLERLVAAEPAPGGLTVRWSGDAVIGRAYMEDVQTSLDRAAVITVFLLILVLLVVYRSPLVAAAPLITIGVGLVISRAVLGWLAAAGWWEVSPLVELFLVVILFGSGTDFCLLISWRFGEHWTPGDPAGAMRTALKHATEPLLTCAGTVIIGLMLMGLTRFKLFSSTGPSVALGLAITLVATLSLTPALLILLARYRPKAFRGMTRPASGFWDDVGRLVLRRPLLAWSATLLLMAPLAVLGVTTDYVQDVLTEVPADRESVRSFDLITEKFGPGAVAPLTVVLGAESDLRDSEGLALIDDLSRQLTRQRRLVEVRSATQPLGSTEPLEPARLVARLAAVREGFDRMGDGASQLQRGLNEGAAKIDAGLRIRRLTGIDLTGGPDVARESLVRGLGQASGALLGLGRPAAPPTPPAAPDPAPDPDRPADPREMMVRDLTRAAEGAGQIARGSERASRELAAILDDPVGRRALDRLLITRETIGEFPDLGRALEAYISPDGRLARFDLVQSDRIFSTEAMRQVRALRRRLHDFVEDQDEVVISGLAVTGANAGGADTWALTRRDQYQTWVIVPLGVYLILLLALRDPMVGVNLVGTMVLTYAFALGVTHLVFITWLGAPGLDWKVPLFLFVLLVAVGVDYNIFLMSRLQQEAQALGLKAGTIRAIAQTGGLISSAAAITVASFSSFLSSPLASLRQLGFALVVGIAVDALLVRPILVPCGHLLLNRLYERRRARTGARADRPEPVGVAG